MELFMDEANLYGGVFIDGLSSGAVPSSSGSSSAITKRTDALTPRPVLLVATSPFWSANSTPS